MHTIDSVASAVVVTASTYIDIARFIQRPLAGRFRIQSTYLAVSSVRRSPPESTHQRAFFISGLMQPRNGDTDRCLQPRYMQVRQGQALVTPRTWDMAKTTRPACAKSPASRNASRRRVKFCRRRFPRDGSDRLALELVGRMPSTRNRLAGRVAAIGHGGKGRRYAWGMAREVVEDS